MTKNLLFLSSFVTLISAFSKFALDTQIGQSNDISAEGDVSLTKANLSSNSGQETSNENSSDGMKNKGTDMFSSPNMVNFGSKNTRSDIIASQTEKQSIITTTKKLIESHPKEQSILDNESAANDSEQTDVNGSSGTEGDLIDAEESAKPRILYLENNDFLVELLELLFSHSASKMEEVANLKDILSLEIMPPDGNYSPDWINITNSEAIKNFIESNNFETVVSDCQKIVSPEVCNEIEQMSLMDSLRKCSNKCVLALCVKQCSRKKMILDVMVAIPLIVLMFISGMCYYFIRRFRSRRKKDELDKV
ncbi:MAG: hypothetical protein MHPSP_000456 [Paramarteilia canceri]